MSVPYLEAIANLGVLGPILALFGWYIWKQHAELRKSEEKRVADANAVLDRLTSLSEKWHALQVTYVRVLDSNTAVIEEVRDALRSLSGTMESPEPRPTFPSRPSRGEYVEETLPEENAGRYGKVDPRRR
jgi:hypothetical protein